jgi:integrase
VRKAVQLVRQALQVAVEDRVITSNPADRLRGLPKVATSEARFCTPAELTRLVDVVDERYRVMILTAGWSGLRLGELCGLRARSVDIASRRLEVVETIGEVQGQLVHQAYGKTGAARRSVPLPAHVVDELAAHVDHLEADDLVFAAPDGGGIRRSLFHPRVWQPATIAAGLGKRVPAPTEAKPKRTIYDGLRIHDLRHTAVSMWIQAGADLAQLKRWAGHESVATLIDTYGHLMPDREQPVLDALDLLAAGAGASNVVPITAAGSAS